MDKNKLSSDLHKYQLKVHEIILNDRGLINGDITPSYRDVLEEYRKSLGISIKDANKIEFTVLKPYKDYQSKIEKYKDKIRKLVTYNQDILLSRNQKILKHLQEILQINKFAVAIAYISVGHEMLHLNQKEISIICFEEAIRHNENNPVAYVSLGNILYKKNSIKEALNNFKKAKKLFEIQNMFDEAREIEEFIHKYNLNNSYFNKITIILRSFFFGYSPVESITYNNIYQYSSLQYNEKNELKILTEKIRFFEEKVESLEEDKINKQKLLENMSENKGTNVNMNFHGSVNSATGNVEGDQKNIFISENKQTLTEAAAEIQKLLKQLEISNPSATLEQKKIFVDTSLSRTFKTKVMNSLKAGWKETVKEILDNSYINIGIAILEGWQDSE